MQAKGLNENAPHTIGDAAQAYAAATLAGMSCSSSDWDALDSAAFRSCTPEPGMLLGCLSYYWLALDLHTSHISFQLLLEGSTGGGRTNIDVHVLHFAKHVADLSSSCYTAIP